MQIISLDNRDKEHVSTEMQSKMLKKKNLAAKKKTTTNQNKMGKQKANQNSHKILKKKMMMALFCIWKDWWTFWSLV